MDCFFVSIIMVIETTDQPHSIGQSRSNKTGKPLLCQKFIHPDEDENDMLPGLHFEDEDSYNFAFDPVDAIARKGPDKLVMMYVANDMTARRFTFNEMKDTSPQSANHSKSFGYRIRPFEIERTIIETPYVLDRSKCLYSLCSADGRYPVFPEQTV